MTLFGRGATEFSQLGVAGLQRRRCLAVGGLQLAPGADVLLLGVELLEAVAGVLQRPGSFEAALADLPQRRGGLVDGIEQYLKS
ncbi:hypothetical protein D3C72_2430600 [compost metagenome]